MVTRRTDPGGDGRRPRPDPRRGSARPSRRAAARSSPRGRPPRRPSALAARAPARRGAARHPHARQRHPRRPARSAEPLPETAIVMLTQSARGRRPVRLAAGRGVRLPAQGHRPGPAGRRAARACWPARRRCRRRLVARILDEFRAPDEAPVRPEVGGGREAQRARVGGDGAARPRGSDRGGRRQAVPLPHHVRVHVSSVLRKLRVKDRQSAFRRCGLTDHASTSSPAASMPRSGPLFRGACTPRGRPSRRARLDIR